MSKNNINSLLAQYEELLGESINIEPAGEVELDPEMMQLQQQLAQQQAGVKQDSKSNAQQAEIDKALAEYGLAPQREQQPRQQQATMDQSDPSEVEQSITQVDQLQSFLGLQQEITYLKKSIPQLKANKKMQSIYNDSLTNMTNALNELINQAKQEKLSSKQYLTMVTTTFKAQERLFKQQTNKLLQSRIADRLKVLQDERNKLNQNLDQYYMKILTQFGCGEDPSIKYLMQEFDSKNIQDKATELFKRHKQYLNMAKYYSAHLKQEKGDTINQIIAKLEKSKQLQEQFKQGQNPSIAKFIYSELTDITEDIFRGCNQIEFKAQLSIMVDQTKTAQREEQAYLKVVQFAKPTLQKVQGQKNMIQVHPADQSKALLQRYEQILQYLDKFEQSHWTPLPNLQIIHEQRQTSLDNRDVPQSTLRVAFKKISKSGKYYLSYSMELNSCVVQQKTATTDNGVFNYIYDINLSEDRRNAMKDLNNKIMEVKLYEKGFFSDTLKGQGTIVLQDLLDLATVEGEISLNDKGTTLQYQIQLREPLNKKKTIQVVNLLNVYPEFNINEGVQEYLQTKIQEIPQQAVQQIQQEVVIQQETEVAGEQEEQQQQFIDPNKLVMLIHMESDDEYQRVLQQADKSPLLKEDILYPEDPKKAPVYFFIEPYATFLKLKSVDLAQDSALKLQRRFIQKLWEDTYRQQMVCQKQLENNDIERYLKNLEASIKRDNLLLNSYKSANAPTWQLFIEQRLEVSQKELNELKSM